MLNEIPFQHPSRSCGNESGLFPIIGTVVFVGLLLDHILFGATLVFGVALVLLAITSRGTRGPV